MVSQLPLTTDEEFKSAVSAAKKAFPSWKNTPITTRQRVMLKFQELIRKNMVCFYRIIVSFCRLLLVISVHFIYPMSVLG